MSFEIGDRVRIKEHPNVTMLLWGKCATVVAESPKLTSIGGMFTYLLKVEDGSQVRLWEDQIERDVLGELAKL